MWTILTNLLEAMELDRCTYQPEVISAVLRRAPLRIPATGFGFRGPGRSYTTSATATLDGFRSDDLVAIRDAHGATPRALNFDHTEGVPNSSDNGLTVRLGPSDWVSYEVNVAEATRLEVAVAPLGGTGKIGISIDGDAVAVESLGDGLLRGTTASAVAPGRHAVRVECLAGDTAIRWLEITCGEALAPRNDDLLKPA